MCGAETIVNYALVIFKRAEVEMDIYLLLILVQSATLSGYTIAAFLTPRVKRKIHFIMGVVLMGISQAICGLALKAEVNSILMFEFCHFLEEKYFFSGLSKWMVYQHK